jgi:hypothetical protein
MLSYASNMAHLLVLLLVACLPHTAFLLLQEGPQGSPQELLLLLLVVAAYLGHHRPQEVLLGMAFQVLVPCLERLWRQRCFLAI